MQTVSPHFANSLQTVYKDPHLQSQEMSANNTSADSASDPVPAPQPHQAPDPTPTSPSEDVQDGRTQGHTQIPADQYGPNTPTKKIR